MQLQTGIAVVSAGVGTVGGFLAGLDPAWIALIGTVVGGVVLKVSETWLARGRVQKDDARVIREELRSTVTTQREDIRELEDEVNEWRSKYYDLRDSYMKVQTELQIALNSVRYEATEAGKALDRNQ